MLFLTRRIGETLCIGEDIQVTLVRRKGNQVRVRIDAPRHTAVHRKELYQKIGATRIHPAFADPAPSATQNGNGEVTPSLPAEIG